MITGVEKIQIILKRKGMMLGKLAEDTDQTRQNLWAKFNRNNLTENEMRKIADKLGCDVEITFKDRETGEMF